MVSKLLRGAREMAAFGRGEPVPVVIRQVPDVVDVRAIRQRLGLTQEEFAVRFGFSKANVQNWEQGHRTPTGSARVLLTVIEREPEAVERALSVA